jgi:hypothetical protein
MKACLEARPRAPAPLDADAWRGGVFEDLRERFAMRILAIAALALALSTTGAAAQTIDANGKCHDAKGKFAKMEVCKSAPAAAPAKCRDKTTKKFAKCSAPNTEAVPAKK